MPKRFTLSLLLALSVTVTVFTRPRDLNSAWRQVDLAVDGNDTEWPGGAALLVDAPVAVGVSNDQEFLYVRIRTSDRNAGMQILMGGLTVWFDAAGGDRKTFGIKYPVGAKKPEPGERGPGGPEGGKRGDMPPPPGGQEGQPGEGRDHGQGPGQGPPLDPSTLVEPRLELLGAKKEDVRSFAIGDVPSGIQAAISRVEGALVYELRVPLATSAEDPNGIGAALGSVLGVTLETGKIRRPEMSRRGGPGGGPGGGMGGPGGGIGGPPGGGPGASAKPLKTTFRVRVAQRP